jgi:hypothetical protein
MDLQNDISNHSKVLEEIPNDILPTGYHLHAIDMKSGSAPPNIKPYRYPYEEKG